MRNTRYLFILWMVISLESTGQNFHPSKNDSTIVVTQLNAFLTAFRNLDYDRFKDFFAENVSVFFPPSAQVPSRVDGRKNVLEVFKSFFDRVRANKQSAPYLDIEPEKMQVKIFQDIAVISFELTDPDGLGRRTIVLRKQHGKYLIEHLHASRT